MKNTRLRIISIIVVILTISFMVDCKRRGKKGMHRNWPQGEHQQTAAVRKLLKRLIPSRSMDFSINVNFSLSEQDTFQIESVEGKILIMGNRGYSAALGLQHYLKYYCGAHISWSGNQLNLPTVLPTPAAAINVTLNDKYRYYMNVCTLSYSTVWWNWKRWEREIDWMALNGINLPLAFTGQEFIWKKVFQTFNFTEDDIDEFFTGPAFLAWNRMGNVQKWAGPLSDNWLSQKKNIQRRILKRMRSFGMTPVLPAFSGRVPPSFQRIYPNASVTFLQKKWGHFDPPYGPVAFLEPADPLFQEIGGTFLKYYISEFGTDHIYNTDLFNEMPPPSLNTSYLKDCGKYVFQTLTSQDPEAVWILQGWMFHFDPDIWTPERAEAFLTSVPIGRMIVLDMQAEFSPQYIRLNSFYGQPFIWSIVQNFGGVNGLYGSLGDINTGPFEARNSPNSTMIGTGMTPEGIDTNDIVYELMNEIAWRKSPVQLDDWMLKFASRRYGNVVSPIKQALFLLKRSVYNASLEYVNHGKFILVSRPSLTLKPFVWYEPADVFECWKLYVNASQYPLLNDSELFRHDLVDVTRQGLSLVMDKFYEDLLRGYFQKSIALLTNASIAILELYDDMEKILATDAHFLLGPWLKSASSCGITELEKKQYLYNARNQITLWGPSGQILDYANKQWTNIMTKYYKKRWKLMLDILKHCVLKSKSFKQSTYNSQVLSTVEIPFTMDDKLYPVTPEGDAVEISYNLMTKYSFYI